MPGTEYPVRQTAIHMARFLRRLSIKYRLMVWFTGLFLIGMTVVGVVVYSIAHEAIEKNVQAELSSTTDAMADMVGAAVELSVRNRLKAIAEKNLDIVRAFEKNVVAGRLTREQAMEQARAVLGSQVIGETGYIYCIDSKGVLDFHPKPGMQGRDMSDHWLGVQQMELKNGYVEYDWANPGERGPRPKSLYMVYFEPWDWIISVSSYRDEFDSLVNVEDFKSIVRSLAFDQSGYAFVLSTNGEALIHPWLSGPVKDHLAPEYHEDFDKILKTPSGQLLYSWQDPNTDTPRLKLMLYRHIPGLDWVVGSSIYLDEAYAPLFRLRLVMLGGGLLTILLILPLSMYLGESFARPLARLTTRMEEADGGDLSVRADAEAGGEIGELATRFNQYMMRLEDFRDELRSEIDERVRAEQQLKLFEMVFENALEGISITDPKGNIVAVNPAFTDITGFTPDEVVGRNPRVLKSDRHDDTFYKDMWTSLSENGQWHGEIWNRRKTGESYPEILSISSVRDEGNHVTNYVAVFHDITDMKLKDEQIEHQVYHDALTGLPNRVLAQDRLQVAISHAKRANTNLLVLFLDLDNFKKINDSLGHAVGDQLLQEVARRLQAHYQGGETVARLGGDEFLVVVEDVMDDRMVAEVTDQLFRAFDDPFMVGSHELYVAPSVGVTVYPDDGQDAGTLIKNADMAMYQAKARGKNAYFMFTQEMNARVTRRLELENDMRQALKDRQFTVYFQPKVRLDTGQVDGMEALVRWIKADGTVVSPADFIPLAEETGLIVPLGEFVLEASCKAMQVMEGIGCTDLSVSVNLSPVQFEQENLVEMVLSNLRANGLPAERLELEITESTLMTDVGKSVEILNQLVDEGISISIDDFGTGHSSLYYLKNFPIDVLKIDRSFVRDITVDESDAQIVETVILMARNLGMDVVAEGAETQEQIDLLASFGCKLIQGFFYSPPLPLEDVIEYIRSENGACSIRS